MKSEDPTLTTSLWLIDIDANGNAKIEIKNIVENQSSKPIHLGKTYTLNFPNTDIIPDRPKLKKGTSDPISLPISNNEISTIIEGELGPCGSPNSKIDFSIDIKLIKQFANIYNGEVVINRILSESAFYSPDILTVEFRFPNPKNLLKKLAVIYSHKPRGTEEERNKKGFTIVRFSQGINKGSAIYPFIVDFMVKPKSNFANIIAFIVSIIGIILTLYFSNNVTTSIILGFILSIVGGILANYFTKKVLPD